MSHICIIEDDAAIAEIERDYLEINGFTVSIATDGVSGLNLTQKESFDLILLDLMPPRLDGFTLCRKSRERLDIPILMVTAKKRISTKSGDWVWAQMIILSSPSPQ